VEVKPTSKACPLCVADGKSKRRNRKWHTRYIYKNNEVDRVAGPSVRPGCWFRPRVAPAIEEKPRNGGPGTSKKQDQPRSQRRTGQSRGSAGLRPVPRLRLLGMPVCDGHDRKIGDDLTTLQKRAVLANAPQECRPRGGPVVDGWSEVTFRKAGHGFGVPNKGTSTQRLGHLRWHEPWAQDLDPGPGGLRS